MRTDTIKVDAHIVMLKERQLFHFLKNYNMRLSDRELSTVL